MKKILLILLICSPFILPAQAPFNFDFEEREGQGKGPKNWYWSMGNPRNYMYALDSINAYSGKYCIKIQNTVDSSNVFGAFSMSIPAEYTGKKIKLQGYIKTENVDGWVSLWMRIDGTREFDNMQKRGLKGSNDWKLYTIELDLKEGAETIVIGGLMSGKGSAWFDKFDLMIDGVDITNAPKEDQSKYQPKPAELTWLKKASVPLKYVDAGNGFTDLQPLKSFVGDARIVALGECTHGTSEIFRMKHRLLEFLVIEMNFSIFSIEANMAETNAINEYVLNGTGEPKHLLDTMYFWTWNTQEVLDMITWMRGYNVKNPQAKVQFTGFDMQYGKGSAEILFLFAKKHAPELVALADSIVHQATRIQNNRTAKNEQPAFSAFAANLEKLDQYFATHKMAIIERVGAKEFEWLAHNVTLLRQFQGLTGADRLGFFYRDKSMAENVEWLLKQNPGARVVLWAHNGHVARENSFMGGTLTKNGHKEDMRVIGFAAGEGTYTAVKSGIGVSSNNCLVVPVPKTFENYARMSAQPLFFIDIRNQNLRDKNTDWLKKKTGLRSIGALEVQGSLQFKTNVLPDIYDGLIYIDKTNASKCFRAK